MTYGAYRNGAGLQITIWLADRSFVKTGMPNMVGQGTDHCPCHFLESSFEPPKRYLPQGQLIVEFGPASGRPLANQRIARSQEKSLNRALGVYFFDLCSYLCRVVGDYV